MYVAQCSLVCALYPMHSVLSAGNLRCWLTSQHPTTTRRPARAAARPGHREASGCTTPPESEDGKDGTARYGSAPRHNVMVRFRHLQLTCAGDSLVICRSTTHIMQCESAGAWRLLLHQMTVQHVQWQSVSTTGIPGYLGCDGIRF